MIEQSCSHRFLGSSTCSLCGWVLPKPYAPAPLSKAVMGILEAALLTDPVIRAKEATVIVPCPWCYRLTEHSAEDRILHCDGCGQDWACERYRTEGEVIDFIRRALAEDCDATRRSFYNAHRVLRAIAEAVDALPTSEGRS